jgi:SulP family sulfate permease
MVSYLTLSESTMNYKTGANTRLTGIISASCCVLVLVFGANTLSYLPLPVLGGMLAYLGFESLIDTVFEDWFRLRRLEYLVIMLILLVIAFYGFLEGVAVGLVFSVILFAASYSRIEVIRNAISGVDLRSNVGRTAGEDYILDQRGRQIYILQLQGYIFFGTAYRLLMRAQLRILSREPAPLRYLVLDCRHVNGIDSSAVASFQRLRRMSENQGVKLIFTEIPRDVETHLTRARVIRDQDDPIVTVYKDIDHGLESCENGLIEDAPTMTTAPPVLSRDLEAVFHNPSEVVRFLGYLKRVELPKGADLFRQGDASKDLFIVESGEVTAWLEIDGEKKKRLRTMGPGTVVGESGLYLDASRSATVVASSPTVLYQLSMEALEEMTQRAPDLAASFHKFVARLLAQRMVNTTNAVKALFN